MARPNKKTPEQWKKEILDAAQSLFASKGYAETSIADIMKTVGGAKGMFYHYFQSKEEVMQALGNQMFFENNPFEIIRTRTNLNGLEKIKSLLLIYSEDNKRNGLNIQALPILKDPHILASAVEENRRILTPLWLDLIEEGKQDGSIKTDYAKELSELLPLINFWLMPSVFPATAEELQHKYRFVMEVLTHMGLPLYDEKIKAYIDQFVDAISERGEQKT